uniref:VCBS repeat-containing protein n=1 Tax=candidate division WOR-3 bacterium TaxID=2052148 RepID=A0A7C3EUN6_UNCW3
MSGCIFPVFLLALFSTVQELGRCPIDSVVEIAAGRFLPDTVPQLLVREQAGAVTLCPGPDRSAGIRVPLYRLALLRTVGQRWEIFWRSGLLLGREAAEIGFLPDCWAGGDFNGDGRDELFLTAHNRMLVVNFYPDGIIADSAAGDPGVMAEAAGVNIEQDGLAELVTLEQQADSAGRRWLVRIWQLKDSRLVPRGVPLVLPDSPPGVRFCLLGSARLEDYPGAPVVIAAEFNAIKPSRYYLLYHLSGDSFLLTSTPFPYDERFSRKQVLAAGRLSLFNVGDTLVAYGYFVPGTGSGMSFAALQDGEWRVLKPRLEPQKTVGLWCRYEQGWLNLRQGRFYLYSEPPFFWR